MFHHAMMGGYLKPTPVKPCMTSDDHHSTSIIMKKKPLSTSTGGRAEGGQDGYITLGGVGNLDHMEHLFMPQQKTSI